MPLEIKLDPFWVHEIQKVGLLKITPTNIPSLLSPEQASFNQGQNEADLLEPCVGN